MAQRSARLSRGQRGGNRDAAWKKSKPLAYGLIGFIVILWFYMLFFRNSRPQYPTPPTTYICNACKTIFDKLPGQMTGMEFDYAIDCTACGKHEAYTAYQCSNKKCVSADGKPFIFPLIPEFTKEELKQIEEYKKAMKAQEEAMKKGGDPSQMPPEMAMGPGMMPPPMMGDPSMIRAKCPKCGLYTMDMKTMTPNPDIKQYYSAEAQKVIDERDRMIQENMKKNK